METTNESYNPWKNPTNEFLWICSGANREILRNCPTDHAKYAGIGGTIFFTALMASMSGGYAFHTIFDDVDSGEVSFITCLFGFIWGLVIFNLDRFMVNTMYSDGKHTISRQEFLGGLPRIVLAIFLGLVISTPIEMKIFNDKIEAQLVMDQAKLKDDARAANGAEYERLRRLETQKSTLVQALKDIDAGKISGVSERRAEKEKELSTIADKIYKEVYGTGVSGKRGYGPATRQLEKEQRRLQQELNQIKAEEASEKKDNQSYIKQQRTDNLNQQKEIERQIKEQSEKIKELETESEKKVEATNGFTARLTAMSEVTSWTVKDVNGNTQDNSMLALARIMIMFLFVAIEVIPTLFKMMVEAGPYDDVLRTEKEKIKNQCLQEISEINDGINTSLNISIEANRNKLEAESASNKKILEEVASVQSELLSLAISKWREDELKKVEENPSAYIKIGTTNLEDSQS